jgi:hypothetical protein
MPLLGGVLTLLGWSYVQRAQWQTVLALALTLLLAMMAKTSSLSLVAGAGLTLLWKDHTDARRWLSRAGRAALLGGPSALWLAWWLSRNKDQTGEYLYVNADLSEALKVPNTAYKYLYFDAGSFLSEGAFNTFGGHMRDTFPTSLAASALTGEFGLEWLGVPWLSLLRLLFVPMLVLLAVGLVSRPPQWRSRPWVPAMMMFCSHALFMTQYNNTYSFACNEDARLWAPIYFPAAVLWSLGHEAALERWTGALRRAAQVTPWLFFVALAFFYKRFFFP